MHTLGVRRSLRASHHLICGATGPESEPHVHDYLVEVQVDSEALDESGYVADITEVADILDQTLGQVEGVHINDLPGMEGLNPSVERLARLLHEALKGRLAAVMGVRLMRVGLKIWETPDAWVSYVE